MCLSPSRRLATLFQIVPRLLVRVNDKMRHEANMEFQDRLPFYHSIQVLLFLFLGVDKLLNKGIDSCNTFAL